MSQSKSETRKIMNKAIVNLIRHPLTLGPLALALALSGCGGGGSQGINTAVSEASIKESNPVFAEPSAPLCSKKTFDVCEEPTSSGATIDQLRTVLTDPQGPMVSLKRHGNTFFDHSKLDGGGWEEGSHDYGSAVKTILIGRNQVVMDNMTYTYSKTLPSGLLQFNGDSTKGVAVEYGDPRVHSFDGIKLSATENKISVVPVPGQSAISTYDVQYWSSLVHLLTDWADAPPANTEIQYEGFATVLFGSGAPDDSKKNRLLSGATCPITLTLNAFTGRLSAPPVTCSYENTTMSFSLKDLTIRGSMVWGGLGNEASAYGSGVDSSNSVTVPLDFTSSTVDAAVYGSGAKFIVVEGSGPRGSFQILAAKK